MTLDLRDLRLRSLELHTGASDTRVMLPRAARIRTRVVLGSVQVDESRFRPVAGGFESPDYATATNRVDIDAHGGVGSLKVITAA